MFNRKTPCNNCPFRKGQGPFFRLAKRRLDEIITAPAFQCHKTLDLNVDEGGNRSGKRPQQCAGLMSLLHREGRANTIMQVAIRMGAFNPELLAHGEAYTSLAEAYAGHGQVYDPTIRYVLPGVGVEPPPYVPVGDNRVITGTFPPNVKARKYADG